MAVVILTTMLGIIFSYYGRFSEHFIKNFCIRPLFYKCCNKINVSFYFIAAFILLQLKEPCNKICSCVLHKHNPARACKIVFVAAFNSFYCKCPHMCNKCYNLFLLQHLFYFIAHETTVFDEYLLNYAILYNIHLLLLMNCLHLHLHATQNRRYQNLIGLHAVTHARAKVA